MSTTVPEVHDLRLFEDPSFNEPAGLRRVSDGLSGLPIDASFGFGDFGYPSYGVELTTFDLNRTWGAPLLVSLAGGGSGETFDQPAPVPTGGLDQPQNNNVAIATPFATTSDDQRIDGVWFGVKWASDIAYSAPDAPSDYQPGYNGGEHGNGVSAQNEGFSQFNGPQPLVMHFALNDFVYTQPADSDDTVTYGDGDSTTTSGGQQLNIPVAFGSNVTSQTGVSPTPHASDDTSVGGGNEYATSLGSSATAIGSVLNSGLNFWVSEGPAPGIGGQETVPPDDQINGAIQAIVVDPSNADVMYVASVNGGVWKTTNATAASPHWVPLTDNLPSLSMGALEFDPTDATHQTLIAGIGATSSFGATHDSLNGVLRSTDGGATWSQLGIADLGGDNITSVAARGTTLLAAAESNWGYSPVNGLFRSTNSGANWTLISDGAHGLPNLTSVSDIVGDPLNSNVLYAAVTGSSGGVFKSTDTGLNWTNITSGIGIIGSTTDKIELAVHHDALNDVVYATVDNNSALSGVFRSVNGGSFAALDLPTGGHQGSLHAAIVADPTDPDIVYVGYGGSSSHYLTRIDASQPSGSQITDISGGSFGSPHVDTRDMQIDANGNLILGTDGGLFRLPTPEANTGAWSAIVGDMSVFELHSIAYDHVSDIVMAGAQDNGTLFQQSAGSATWDHVYGGDGGDVAIDDVSLAGSGKSIRYFSSQFLGGWTRQVYDSSNNFVSSTPLASITDGHFATPVELNNVNPTRLLVGGSGHIYESLNQGTSLTSLVSAGANSIDGGGGGKMVYGGYQGGVANPDLIYAASGANVLVQTTGGGGFATTSPGGTYIRGVTDNPTNWASVFAIDDNQVFQSTNTGGIWADVTANLTSISAADFYSMEYVHGTLDDALVVGTSSGVFYSLVSALGGMVNWSEFGSNLPDVITYDLEYDSADNVLVAGTMGRGAWLVDGVTYKLGIDTAPDLVASSAALSGIDLNYSVDNIGTAIAGASTTGIYLSADSTIDTGDTVVGTNPTPALGIGASDGESSSLLSLMFPTNLTPGTYFLGAAADYNSLITEILEGNNASNGVPVIVGNADANALVGTSGADWIIGLSGNDGLIGGNGSDVLLGGDGADRLIGGLGGDTLNGGSGQDVADYSAAALAVHADLGNAAVNSGEAASDSYFSIEKLVGSAFNDTLTGDGGNNRLTGLDGNDVISGSGGSDTLVGNDGNDRLIGGLGGDTLNGGSGQDVADYSAAASAVHADLGNAAVNSGEAASDSYFSIEKLVGSAFNDTLTGDGGNNRLAGLDGNDRLDGGGGADALFGSNGNDRLIGGLGGDTLNGGSGQDVADYSAAASAVHADLGNAAVNSGEAASDSYVSIEKLVGSAFNDTLTGDGGNNRLAGLDGNDRLDGGGGADALFGSNGNDRLIGGLGGDTLNGGSGQDVADYSAAASAVHADLGNAAVNSGEAASDSYFSIEKLVGSAFNDTLTGDGGNNRLAGLDGNDRLDGGGGADSLFGSNGNDTLTGGTGKDQLTGGTGADTFVFNAVNETLQGPAHDVVADFSSAQGDLIDLSQIDADTGNGGDQAFNFIGGSGFSHTAGELRFSVSGGNGYLAGDVNGDGHANLTIELTGVIAFTSGDLIA